MQPTTYQQPELRDANDQIIRSGTFGKNTALSNSTNDGWIDYVMNNLEYLHNNYLPLSAGTPTTDPVCAVRTLRSNKINSDSLLTLNGGYLDNTGGQIVLVGENYTSNQGAVIIRPRNTNRYVELIAFPNGVLRWNNKYVALSNHPQETPIGTHYSAAWTAAESTASTWLTNKIENVPVGVYLLEIKIPVINANLFFLNAIVTGGYININISTGGLSNQGCSTKVVNIINATNSVQLQAAQSAACSFSYLERGGIALTRIA